MDKGASDIHLVAGLPPMYRIHTVLEPADGYDKITPEQTEQCVKDLVRPAALRSLPGEART